MYLACSPKQLFDTLKNVLSLLQRIKSVFEKEHFPPAPCHPTASLPTALGKITATLKNIYFS